MGTHSGLCWYGLHLDHVVVKVRHNIIAVSVMKKKKKKKNHCKESEEWRDSRGVALSKNSYHVKVRFAKITEAI